MIPSHSIPSHPGEVLREEYLAELGLTAAELGAHIGVETAAIEALVREEVPLTPGLAWLIGMATGTGPELWMTLQANHDLARSRPERGLPRFGVA